LSQELEPFGISGDELVELTSRARDFSILFELADSRPLSVDVREVPVQPNSSRVRPVLARLRFRSGFALGFCCSRFVDGLSFCSGRSGSGADGPPGPCGQFVFPGSSLVVLVESASRPLSGFW
jgi:hypothetical protein